MPIDRHSFNIVLIDDLILITIGFVLISVVANMRRLGANFGKGKCRGKEGCTKTLNLRVD